MPDNKDKRKEFMRMLTINWERVQKYQEALNLSDRQLSKRLGIDPSMYSNIKHGKRPIPTYFVEALIREMRIKVEDILDWKENGDTQSA